MDDKVFKVFSALIIRMCIKMKHGIATIVKPVLYPTIVSAYTPFQIKYTIKNTSYYTDSLWAYLMVNGRKLANSEWKKILPAKGSVTATYNHPGISKNTVITLKTGY